MRKPHVGILVKPTSYDCNMACDYCYYRPVQSIYAEVERPRMDLETVDEFCRQYRALEPTQIKIGWQGGEPTLMGLDFFREVIKIETRHARRDDCWGNSLQTNGMVLDDRWCEFLAENHFLVGLSIDGPPHLNTMRKFPDGSPTHQRAMQSLALLEKHKVETNILVVISQVNVDHPEEVLKFLVDNEQHFSQVIPCTEPAAGGGVSEHSITSEQYGEFMTRLFDAWVENDDPGYYVRHIDNWLHIYFGLMPECCEYRQDCANLITIEWNGDVYPCDFFVEDRYRMGNVREQTLEQMLNGRAWREFTTGAEHYPAVCKGCEWLACCHGGCYRHRAKLGLGADEKPYLCEANKRIFSHAFAGLDALKAGPDRPRLHQFLKDLERRVASGEFGPQPQDADAGSERSGPTPPQERRNEAIPGRNAPCPCGSGRKFKNCCARPAPERR